MNYNQRPNIENLRYELDNAKKTLFHTHDQNTAAQIRRNIMDLTRAIESYGMGDNYGYQQDYNAQYQPPRQQFMGGNIGNPMGGYDNGVPNGFGSHNNFNASNDRYSAGVNVSDRFSDRAGDTMAMSETRHNQEPAQREQYEPPVVASTPIRGNEFPLFVSEGLEAKLVVSGGFFSYELFGDIIKQNNKPITLSKLDYTPEDIKATTQLAASSLVVGNADSVNLALRLGNLNKPVSTHGTTYLVKSFIRNNTLTLSKDYVTLAGDIALSANSEAHAHVDRVLTNLANNMLASQKTVLSVEKYSADLEGLIAILESATVNMMTKRKVSKVLSCLEAVANELLVTNHTEPNSDVVITTISLPIYCLVLNNAFRLPTFTEERMLITSESHEVLFEALTTLKNTEKMFDECGVLRVIHKDKTMHIYTLDANFVISNK